MVLYPRLEIVLRDSRAKVSLTSDLALASEQWSNPKRHHTY